MAAPQGVPKYVGTHLSSELRARFLVEAEVNSTVDARVVDVAGDLPEGAVLERDASDRRIAERDEMMARAEHALEHLTSRATRASMRRCVAREARCKHERREGGVPASEQIPIGIAGADRSLGGARSDSDISSRTLTPAHR